VPGAPRALALRPRPGAGYRTFGVPYPTLHYHTSRARASAQVYTAEEKAALAIYICD
jgi:hypothetical protein